MRSPDGALAALAATQHALVTRRQARGLGLSAGAVAARLRHGLLDEPTPGVLRLVAAPATWHQAVRAATLAGAGNAVASHRSAAALHRLDGFGPGPVEVSVPASSRLRVPGIRVHHVGTLQTIDVLTIDGIPCTGLARTLADLGSVVDEGRVERALDDVRRRGTSLRWLRDTALRLYRPGQAGTGILLALLGRPATEADVRGSWFEKLVEDCLRSADLPPLVRQHRVFDRRGGLAGILDLAFPAIRLGVEAHSRQFHFGRAAEGRDEDRDHRLARLGWEVLYVGWQGAKNPAAVLQIVLDTAHHRRALLIADEV